MDNDPRDYSVSPARRGCKRCGSRNVAWQTSKGGKWYLTEIFEDASGRLYTSYRLFHSEFCGDEEAHDDEQAKRNKEEGKVVKKNSVLRKAREDADAAAEAEYFLALHDLCKNEPAQAKEQLGQRERERDGIQSQQSTMDHMNEHMKELARIRRLNAEIDFMRAALGMTRYED